MCTGTTAAATPTIRTYTNRECFRRREQGSEVGQGKEGGERAKKERLAKGRQIGVQQCRQTDANCGDK